MYFTRTLFSAFASMTVLVKSLPFLVMLGGIGIINQEATAQVESPDRKFLFLEDRTKKKEQRARKQEIQKKRADVAKQAAAKGLPVDINATNIDYDSQNKRLKGSGGVIISYGASIIEAQEGEVGVDDKNASLKGDVRITDPTGTLSADEVSINLDNGSGTLKKTDITFEDGDYRLFAEEADKLQGDSYELTDTTLSTCACPEGGSCLPWEIRADKAKITRDGYGQAWGATLRACNIPVFYTPYLIFPAKSQRQTGFLPARVGGGRRGFELSLPFFWALDRATDATITPLVETETRYGVDTEFRKVFSQKSTLELGVTYLNESLRRGDLQDTITVGLNDPTIDTNRLAGYLDHYSSAKLGDQSAQFIVEGKYVSDDLILREFQKDRIADYDSRFVTSTAVARTSVSDTYSLELSSEFNQAMVDNDDFVFQRLPELSLAGFNTYRPFGANALGARIVHQDSVTLSNFYRKEGFDGRRFDVFEKVRLPFHYRNYFDMAFSADVHGTYYETDSREIVSGQTVTDTLLPSTSDRIVPGFNWETSTAFERVFPVSDNNPLKLLAELGQVGRSGELVRIKHTLEPGLKYRYVPYVNQSDTPQFDTIDRLSKRNVVTYQLLQRFFGRYEGRDEYLYGIEETTPEIEDMDPLSTSRPIDDAYNYMESLNSRRDDYRSAASGGRREFANFKIFQSFDVEEDRSVTRTEDERGIETNPFSDVGMAFTLLPNEYLRFGGAANFDPDSLDPSSYSLGTQLLDKRGDQLRSRISFIDASSNAIRQMETSGELRLTDRIKLAYYSRYDDIEKKFLEQKAGIRLKSKCNCWIFDLDVSDRTNPNETRFAFNLTLIGLGEFGNTFLTDDKRRQRGLN